ncbi:MAG: c-type cytochrome [bacterium]|nr:c-type cytochrome [bacterium]MCP5068365.1 c-type cytochrome [bacterium]
MTSRVWFGIALSLLLWVGPAGAQQAASTAPQKAGPKWVYDPYNARDILETCAACHGRNGEGGKDGAYPRLAGLDAGYLQQQIRAFKKRERINIPMYPYATERELPPDDVRDVARLLSEIELPTEQPPPDAELSALERLMAAQAVFNVPRVDGNVERGAEIYSEECGECHGEEGWGEDDVPQLAGQHTNYLRRQIKHFRSGKRMNEDMDDVFEGLDDDDLEDIFAYLAARDD